MSDLEFIADLKHLRYIGVYILYLVIKRTFKKTRKHLSMADYLQYALRDHPRTRRLGELIADFAYPITHSVLGSGFVPFPGALLKGVDRLKQTSDYIFQPPYERLLHQIEESRRLKQTLESQLLSSEVEYQSLRCAHTPNISQSEILRAEHSLAISAQRSSFQLQFQNLQSQISILNSRVEALVLQLSKRDNENSSLKASLEGKDQALLAALSALEAIRAESNDLDQQAEKEKENEAVIRPRIDTTDSYQREHGILTPRSFEELREFSSPMIDITTTDIDPAQIPLPLETDSLLDEEPLEELAQENEHEKEPVPANESIQETEAVIPESAGVESSEHEKEGVKASDDTTVDVESKVEASADAEAKIDASADTEAKVDVPAHTEDKEQLAPPAESVSDVIETSNDTVTSSQPETDMSAFATEQTKVEVSSPAEVDHTPESIKDAEAKPTIPIPTIDVVDISDIPTPQPVHTPAASPAVPQRSPSPSSIPVRGKHSKNASEYTYNTFGFGAPDLNFKTNRSPSPSSPARKKKHHSGFFGRHEHSHTEADKESSKEKDKQPSLRARVFSTPSDSQSHSISHPKSKSDEESSINSSSGQSKKRSSQDRPDSPNSIGKINRRHSRFETYIVDPLERKASQVVRKGRELLRHDSEHSLRRHHDHSQ